MPISKETGLLMDARYLSSPNADARPNNHDISLIVLHNISLPPGEFGTGCIEQLFTNCLDFTAHPYFQGLRDLQVSSHVLICRQGQITQFVPFHQRAWHAGVSSYQGRERCNDFSIGIELEGVDHQAYEPVQYQRLATLIAQLIYTYSELNKNDIVGHCDIASGRKTDPGPAFDWGYFRQLLQQVLNGNNNDFTSSNCRNIN